MSELSERLQEVRKHFGNMSARKLSQELGVAVNSWRIWEAGDSLPAAPALIALAKRGIDVHWLLVGEGQMLRPSGSDEADGGLMALSRLFSSPRGSHWKQRMEIGGFLAKEYPNALSMNELMLQFDLTEEQVAVCLLLLVSTGKVAVREQNGQPLYAATGPQPGVPERSVSDKTEMVVDILRFIGTDVLAATESSPSNGVIFDGRASVRSGQEFIGRVLAAIKDEAIQQHSSEGSNVRLILAALSQ